jgi:hypothetical protein
LVLVVQAELVTLQGLLAVQTLFSTQSLALVVVRPLDQTTQLQSVDLVVVAMDKRYLELQLPVLMARPTKVLRVVMEQTCILVVVVVLVLLVSMLQPVVVAMVVLVFHLQ